MYPSKFASTLTTLPLALAAMWAAAVQAETATSSLHISATVVENCIISTTGLSFGAYDPILANVADPLNGTGVVTVSCTTGTQASVMLIQGGSDKTGGPDNPAQQMSDAVSNQISYALYSDPGRSVIWGGTEETCVRHMGIGRSSEYIVYGSIAPGQNLPEGNYSASVLATVIF